MKRIFSAALALVLATFAVASHAAPLAYINTPFDTPNAPVNALIQQLNGGGAPLFSYLSTCSGTTTATCPGTKVTVTVTGLTTAAAGVSAAFNVVNAQVTAASQIQCQVNNYAGTTGIPSVVNIQETAFSSFTFQIQNTAASGALNGNVPVACQILN